MKIGSPVYGLLLLLVGSTALLACSEPPRKESLDPYRAGLPTCSEGQLAGIAPTPDEVAAHRQYEVPVLTVSGPYDPERTWGLDVAMLVDRSGAVVCHEVDDAFGRPQAMTAERLTLLQAMTDWRLEPFLREGMAVPAVVREHVYEQHLPQQRRAAPQVSLDQVAISLHRSGCFGSCPVYNVEIRGDGTVTYNGEGFVDVVGEHHYRIPVHQVASLVTNIERMDLWSMDDSYRSPITDNPTYLLTLRFGNQAHQIEDYVGSMVGMPLAVREFQNQVDQIGRAAEWTSVSVASVERLREEGFDFRSTDAASLLVRAIGNTEGQDEQAMLRLIEYGAPLDGGKSNDLFAAHADQSLLDRALENHRLLLVAPLIERGALRTGGALDQSKLDAAFRSAIRGGRLEAVQAIWDQGANGKRPSLFFADQSEDGDPVRRQASPVTLLLSRRYGDEGWEGMQIAQWLSTRGCDLNAHAASGSTLLHIAAESGDIAFVRYLLEQKVDVNALGEFDLPALGSAKNEDVALELLQAGSQWEMNDRGEGFLRYARDQHWGRVLAWLENHHGPLP